MDPISTVIKVGLFKGITKLITHALAADPVSEAIATEIAGAAAKRKTDDALSAVVNQYVQSIVTHPEHRTIPKNELHAVAAEASESFSSALDPEFLAQCGFDPERILSAIYEKRGHGGVPAFSRLTA